MRAPINSNYPFRVDSGLPAETVVTHSLDEMIEEAAKRHAAQLKYLIEVSGCCECGAQAVAIQYPPAWEAQAVWDGRQPFDLSLRAVEITSRLRPLCAVHVRTGWEST